MKALFPLAATAILALPGPSAAQSLADFGHGSMLINGQPSLGVRRLVIIRADITGDDAASHAASYYDTMVFNWLSFPSVNGFMLENSGGRFYFTRGGTGMVDMIHGTNFTDAERADFANDTKKAGHIINAASRAGFDFADMDENNDGSITQDELTVLVVENQSVDDSGAARWANPTGSAGPFAIQNSSKQFNSSICLVTQNVSFATLAHELSHLLGMRDLYGVWNQECLSNYLTLASCTISRANNPDTYHLDPWHKMRLGWCEPRIRDMQWGGVETLPANQGNQPDKHVILYDSARGTGEFFMLEYRTESSGGFAGYDEDVNDSGLVIWHIQQDGAHNPVVVNSPYVPDVDPVTPGIQPGMHDAVWAETRPGLTRGGGKGGPEANAGAWGSNAFTPKLRWNDGAGSPSQIYVRPFAGNPTSITIEIISARDTWTDFNFVPVFENGSFGLPYNTLWEGVYGASWGGTIYLKSGRTLETGTITKRLQLNAWNGPVTLGN